MAFTVRPVGKEMEVIQKAADKLGVKSMSKAVIQSCGEMLHLQHQLKEMERKHYQSQRRAEKAESVISALMNFKVESN